MRGCILGLKTCQFKGIWGGRERGGASPFFYFSFLVLWLKHDRVKWIQTQLIQPRGAALCLQSKLDWQQLLAVTADNNITLTIFCNLEGYVQSKLVTSTGIIATL